MGYSNDIVSQGCHDLLRSTWISRATYPLFVALYRYSVHYPLFRGNYPLFRATYRIPWHLPLFRGTYPLFLATYPYSVATYPYSVQPTRYSWSFAVEDSSLPVRPHHLQGVAGVSASRHRRRLATLASHPGLLLPGISTVVVSTRTAPAAVSGRARCGFWSWRDGWHIACSHLARSMSNPGGFPSRCGCSRVLEQFGQPGGELKTCSPSLVASKPFDQRPPKVCAPW